LDLPTSFWPGSARYCLKDFIFLFLSFTKLF